MTTVTTDTGAARRRADRGPDTDLLDRRGGEPRQTTALRRSDAPERPHRRLTTRTGSRQVLSVRGRRMVAPTTTAPALIRFVVGIILVGLVGIGAAMWLSAVTTEQSFRLSEARTRGQALTDEVTTLERDVEHARSTAEISRRAEELGMVHLGQPGVLVVDEHGTATEVRDADAASVGTLVDLNDGPIRPLTPTSDPAQTAQVPGMSTPAPEEAAPATAPQLPALAPYSPGMQATQAGPAATQAATPADTLAAPAVPAATQGADSGVAVADRQEAQLGGGQP